MLKIILYSTEHCPKCKILKQKLQETSIEYEICQNVEEMISMNMQSVPMLKINDKLLDFSSAVQWLKEETNDSAN